MPEIKDKQTRHDLLKDVINQVKPKIQLTQNYAVYVQALKQCEDGGPPTSRRKVCRTVAVIGFVHLARCFLVAMAEAEFHVVKPVSCQQNWGIPGWHSYLQCCYDFPRRCSDRQGTSRYEIFCIGIRMMSQSVLIRKLCKF